MTVLSTIITEAYEELNLIGIGKSPTDNQNTRGLRRLNQLLGIVLGGDAGEELTEWPLGNYGRQAIDTYNYGLQFFQNPFPNARLTATATEAMTVYFPPDPSDGCRMGLVDPFSRLATYPVTLDANGHTVEGATTLLVNANGTDKTWIYRADKGNWLPLTSLTLTDEMPFPEEFDTFFTILLALRISPSTGRKMEATTAEAFKKASKKFVNRYLQNTPMAQNADISFATHQSYNNYANAWFGGNTEAFNRGGGPW